MGSVEKCRPSHSPGQPSLVHSQEPWRHTLQESHSSVSGSREFAPFVPIVVVSPGVAVLGDGGSRWEMSAHVHAGTLGHFHTARPVQDFTH